MCLHQTNEVICILTLRYCFDNLHLLFFLDSRVYQKQPQITPLPSKAGVTSAYALSFWYVVVVAFIVLISLIHSPFDYCTIFSCKEIGS